MPARFRFKIILCLCTVGVVGVVANPAEVTGLMAQGSAAHHRRSLGEASGYYRQGLALEPPADLTPEQLARVVKFAPRLHTVAGEFFPLKDMVVIVHPDQPLIAYHLFWEDDIAYPADNEPCDHEIVWIDYDPATERVVRVRTYFHGKIVESAAAVEDANRHAGRAWIGVEWGFHGSIPLGAMDAVAAKLHEHWQLAQHGQEKQSPLARGWPTQFAGSYAEYVDFATPGDPMPLLKERKMAYVSRWANAVINQYCLRYNFAPKPEWPWLAEAKP